MRPWLFATLAVLGGMAPPARAGDDPSEWRQLRQQIDEMRQQYEARLRALEDRLSQAEKSASAPTNDVSPASAAAAGNPGGFNPSIALILSGRYASLSRDPDTWRLTGFLPSGNESGPGRRGFDLGESEVSLSANIDPWFYGSLTLSLARDNTVAAEEAFVQTTALSDGLKIKAGRFFSGLGYLNEQHAHTWDFVDAPLAYQAFLGGQYGQEGAQFKWLTPIDQFVELGAELGSGAGFPGTDRNRNAAGSIALYGHAGGDWGASSSWRAGLSYLQTRAHDRDAASAGNSSPISAFSGKSKVWVLDGVWKWAPNGNATRTNFKLQGEYFRRTETGDVAYVPPADPTTTASAAYRSAQSGWYLQGIYQFMPPWRVGLRFDQLDSGSVDFGLNGAALRNPDDKPQRTSLMVDWSLSEFSRWRVQWADDRAREGLRDRQFFLQYQMSLGAHGAHSY